MEEDQALIPGLPDDVSSNIIALIPQRFVPALRPVCRRWRDLVASPSFLRLRGSLNSSQDLVFLVQSAEDPTRNSAEKSPISGDYVLSVYNSTEDSWQRVICPEPIPMFAQIVGVGGKVVVMGGWDGLTLESVSSVRVLDLVTGEWREGKAMPAKRSFFACAAVGGRVYVAGGHDGMKNALRTAEAYDVERDEWAAIPAMREERDECKGAAFDGKFWALSGYKTDSQGRFLNSGEFFDVERGIWTETVAAGERFAGGESLWWKEVAPAAEGRGGGGCCAAVMAGGKVFGMSGEGGEVTGWVLENGVGKKRVETPVRFTGFVYSAAAVRI